MKNLTEIGEALGECAPKMDIPGSLPIEMFHEILKYLSPRDLHNARDCCKNWRSMMQTFWKIKCKTECYYETEDDLNSKFYREYTKQFSRWEGIYMYNSKLEDNWINLRYKEVVKNAETSFNGFSIQYFNGDVIIGVFYYTREILVINSTTAMIEKCFNNLTFPEGFVAKRILAAGKFENKVIAVIGNAIMHESPSTLFIKTWNIETGEPLQSLQMETIEGSIGSVQIYNNLITALSCPYAVNIYNIKTEKMDYIRYSISGVCHNNDKIAMAIYTGTIVILDLDYTELMTFNCCDTERKIYDIRMNGNYLITFCGSDYKLGSIVCVWNIETKTKLYQVENIYHKCWVIHLHEKKLFYKCIEFQDERKLLVVDRYKLCDLDTGECILDFPPEFIVTRSSFVIKRDISNQHLLKLWSIKTGKLIADLNLPRPLSFVFCENTNLYSKTKSKYVYLHYDATINNTSLNIMDFDTNM